MDDLIVKLLKKNLRGELYDLTFTSKGNVTGKLKSQQEGTTLTLEKAIYELLIMELTSIDDKSKKRELRKNFLIRCYYEDDLKKLFEAYTEFLNGGENTTSPFIINVSGGNLIILFAWLIMHINSVKKISGMASLFTQQTLEFGTDKLKAQFQELMSVEKKIPEEIIESAILITENGFSDLDFYIIENSKYNGQIGSGGAPKNKRQGSPSPSSLDKPPPSRQRIMLPPTLPPIPMPPPRPPPPTPPAQPPPTPQPPVQDSIAQSRGRRNFSRSVKLQEEQFKEIEARKAIAEERKKLKTKQQDIARKQAQEKADELNRATEAAKDLKPQPKPKLKEKKDFKKDIREDEEVNQGFIVYRIKTGVFLQDYLDIVFQKNGPNDPKEFTDLKDALLDLFIFYIENEDYNPFETDHITEDEYKILHTEGLPTTFGKKQTQIEIYPQIFQKKYLKEGLGLSKECVKHLNYLNYQKRIIETSKNLNIFLLLRCLKEKYKKEPNYINLILFLNELCITINSRLQYVTIDSFDTFESLDTLKESQSVNNIINIARQILIEHEITKSLKQKLINLFHISPYSVKLVSSRSIVKNDPQVDDVLIYIPDKHSEHFDDNELLKIDDNVSIDEIKESVPLPPKEAGYKKKIGKKLKKSKKKRKVNKKTKNKHNKKNKRTRRKKNNKTEKKVRK